MLNCITSKRYLLKPQKKIINIFIFWLIFPSIRIFYTLCCNRFHRSVSDCTSVCILSAMHSCSINSSRNSLIFSKRSSEWLRMLFSKSYKKTEHIKCLLIKFSLKKIKFSYIQFFIDFFGIGCIFWAFP